MSLIFALNGLTGLAVSLAAFYVCYSLSKKEDIAGKIGAILGVNGIFYLLISFLNIFWFSGMLEPNNKDFIVVSAVLTVVSSILILYMAYKITGNRNLVYLLILFITTIFAINFSIKAFFIATLGVSYVLMSIVFMHLFFFSNYYLKRAGLAGMVHVFFSVILLALALFGKEAHTLPWFLPNVLMFFVFLLIYQDIINLGVIKREGPAKDEKLGIFSYILTLGKFIVFICSISVFILVSSVAVHELGHALVAQYYGCEQFKAVIYDIVEPHTEIKCKAYYNNFLLTLAGLGATSIIALVFLLTGTQFTIGISYLLFGFGLLIVYGDLVDIGTSKNIIALILLSSVIVIGISIVKIAAYHLKQQDVFKEGVKYGIEKPELKKKIIKAGKG